MLEETTGASGRVAPKRLAGIPVSPGTGAEESGPVHADGSGPVRADGFTDEDMVQEEEEVRHVSAPVLPSEAEVEAHNVSHLPFRSWCSACVRGRALSLGHRRVDAKTKEAEQIPTISVDCGFFGQPEDRAHDTLLVLSVRDRKSKGIWSHPVPSKGVVYPYPARALMADLDLMVYKRVILKSDQPSIVALFDAVKNGWHGKVVPEAFPKGESKSNGEVERAVQSVHGLARTLKDILAQQSGIALESRSPMLAWLVELLLLFHKGEPHDGHTAYMRLKGKPWRVEMPSIGECVDFCRRTRHKLESRWCEVCSWESE